MTDHALVLIHRASSSIERLAKTLRAKGCEPLVLSSRLDQDPRSFRDLCARLKLSCWFSDGDDLGLDDALRVLAQAPSAPRFCIGIWDGHRGLMAQVNQRLGAVDLTPQAVAMVQDKLATRLALRSHGLTRLRAWIAGDAQGNAAMTGARFIARPRRGAGALLTAVVTAPLQVETLRRKLHSARDGADPFGEFFVGNDIFVEDFYEGVEFSLELLRTHGRTLFACWHEKTRMETLDETILERGFASPPVSVDAAALAQGLRHCEQIFEALGLDEGCFHVELLRGAGGDWELIEANLRPGGGLVSESVFQQYGARPSADWIDILLRRPVTPHGERACGTYQQFCYPQPGRGLRAIHRRPGIPAPAVEIEALAPGKAARGDREEFAIAALWRTSLTDHANELARLALQDFVDFEYDDAAEPSR